MNVIDFLTLLALKMVMMPVTREFKAWVFAWQHDLPMQALVNHRF
jgi:hypothetical protein